MRPKRIDELKKRIIEKGIIIFVGVVVFIVMIIMIYNSMHEGEMAIYNAGIENTPIIKSEDLQELGKLYSKLNESFEREIDKITTGRANRNNKLNQVLNHYGVYGKENKTEFINNDYENGINIRYVKSERYKYRPDGDSNFKDIIGAMSIIYEQKMDIATASEMKELFEEIFWMTHTFQYDSTELYACEHGCDAVKGYKCTDAYNEFAGSNLKYNPFTVRGHNLYAGYEEEATIEEDSIEVDDRGRKKITKGKYRDDFNIVYPQSQCSVHGISGAGCVLDKSRICFHGTSDMYDEEPLDSDYYEVVEVESATEDLPDFAAELFKEKDKPEEEDDDDDDDDEDDAYADKEPKEFLGSIMDKTKTCSNYKIIRYCRETKKLKQINDKIREENRRFSKIKNPSEGASEAHEKTIERLEDKRDEIMEELEIHMVDCERENPEYLCGGFNICVGHGDHYRCDKHNVVVCFGHTTINMNVKILYGMDIIEEFYKAFDSP